MTRQDAVAVAFAVGILWGAFAAGVLSAIDGPRNRLLTTAGLCVVAAGLGLLVSWVLS